MRAQYIYNAKVEVFKTVDEVNRATANLIIEIADKAIEQRGRFSIALSGGNTPKSLYSLLSQPPYSSAMPWQHTFVFWGDERCVPLNDENNNAHMAKKALLDKVTIPAKNIFIVPTDLAPVEAAKQYEKTLHSFFGTNEPQFDCMLLGLGDNGHTASLFPATDVLNETTHWVKEVFVEELNMWRITLTVPVINQSRNIIFLVEGEKKADIVNTILNSPPDTRKYPAQLIKTNGNLVWILDEKAAKLL